MQPSDEAQWRVLWDGYNSFYGVAVDADVTSALWRRLTTPDDIVFGRVAEDAYGLSGFALCVLHPYTWGTSPACLLEDLYVDPRRRGGGVGRSLVDSLILEAKTRRWARLYWHTRQDNAAARRLYDSYTASDGFVRYILSFSGAVSTTGGSSLP